MKVCSFTGHRLIKREHLERLPSLLLRAIDYAYSKGCRTFLAGGALGFDTLAAKAVIKYRLTHGDVRLHLILPCVDQGANWSESSLREYEYTQREADEVIYISDSYTDTCMKERNLRLASECDLLIAYVSRKNSGAAQTVRMATNMKKEVYNLYPNLDLT